MIEWLGGMRRCQASSCPARSLFSRNISLSRPSPILSPRTTDVRSVSTKKEGRELSMLILFSAKKWSSREGRVVEKKGNLFSKAIIKADLNFHTKITSWWLFAEIYIWGKQLLTNYARLTLTVIRYNITIHPLSIPILFPSHRLLYVRKKISPLFDPLFLPSPFSAPACTLWPESDKMPQFFSFKRNWVVPGVAARRGWTSPPPWEEQDCQAYHQGLKMGPKYILKVK